MKAPAGKHVLVGITVVVVVTAVVIGIVMLGPPGEERARRLDQRRARDLQGIGLGVDAYWTIKGRLPASLEEVSKEAGVASFSASDPVTGAPYSYRVVGDQNYELCATFDRASSPRSAGDLWTHGAGMRCFTRRAGASPK
jgi:hypothetical protein